MAIDKRPTIIAYMKCDCWVDLGIKAIFFSDGTAYIFKPVKVDPSGKVNWHPMLAKITRQQMKELVCVFNDNHFNDVPTELNSRATDGNEIYVYFSTPTGYHKVKDYMVKNEALELIGQYISKLYNLLIADASEISIDQMLSDMRFRLKQLPVDSPNYECMRDFLNNLQHLYL